MILLDAHALVALLVDEPAAEDVERILGSGDAAVPAVNLAETIDVSVRFHGVPDERARSDLEVLVESSLRVLPCGESSAFRAGLLRARHYHRRRRPVSIPDCVLVASAEPGDAIATADHSVLEVARAEGIDVIPLPDSRRRRSQ